MTEPLFHCYAQASNECVIGCSPICGPCWKAIEHDSVLCENIKKDYNTLLEAACETEEEHQKYCSRPGCWVPVKKKNFEIGYCTAYMKAGKCVCEGAEADEDGTTARTYGKGSSSSASSTSTFEQRSHAFVRRPPIGQRQRSSACTFNRSRSPPMSRGAALSTMYDHKLDVVLSDKLYCAARDLKRIATDIAVVARMLERKAS